ncbi:hypothetical protein M758_UG010500 [Ceratodon purpureus]|nr:hypothetical protein M758_UG010500 [Ceratodon purpureus]
MHVRERLAVCGNLATDNQKSTNLINSTNTLALPRRLLRNLDQTHEEHRRNENHSNTHRSMLIETPTSEQRNHLPMSTMHSLP